ARRRWYPQVRQFYQSVCFHLYPRYSAYSYASQRPINGRQHQNLWQPDPQLEARLQRARCHNQEANKMIAMLPPECEQASCREPIGLQEARSPWYMIVSGETVV